MGEPKPLLAQTNAKPISYDDNPIELPLRVINGPLWLEEIGTALTSNSGHQK